MKKIHIIALVLAAFAITSFTDYSAYDGEQGILSTNVKGFEPIVVLELFTSQGCSSCPAADALLNKVKKMSGKAVFTLSYHVDYWNYIGWDDPFSASRYARKQQLYNQKFNNRGNYTPQMVVNGKEHFVGSNSSKLYEKIATYKKLPALNEIEIAELAQESDKIRFGYEIAGEIEDKKLRAILVLDERTTYIKAGENKNRTLVNGNIVVAERIEDIRTRQGFVVLDMPKGIRPNESVNLVVLVQNKDYDITGAVKSGITR